MLRVRWDKMSQKDGNLLCLEGFFNTRGGFKGDGRRDILSTGAVIVAATQSEFELAYYYNYHHHYYYYECFLVGVLATKRNPYLDVFIVFEHL